MRCYVCGKEIPWRRRYCDRCYAPIRGKDDKLKRRVALMAAYDPSIDAFRDHYPGVVLELDDPDDPFHISFDHVIPEETSELVATSMLFNQLKYEFIPEEFRRAVEELAAHFDGGPFNAKRITFSHWGARAPRRRRPCGNELTKVVVEACVICGDPPRKWSPYCPRCRRFVLNWDIDHTACARAMKRALDAEKGGFLCWYTGVRLYEEDPGNPWYLTFDHRVPGDDGTVVVAAWWVNRMKTALSDVEFKAVIREYRKHLDGGGGFDRHVVEFRYWRKAYRSRKRTH